jgi:hypothetical protein
VKTAAFTLRADPVQSVRWKQVASAEGFSSVGSWAACALDAYLKARAKAGKPLPLAWYLGAFRVRPGDGRELELRGKVSPPFAIFRGTAQGPDRNKLRTLVHLPTGAIIATLRSARQCRALASELAPVLLRGELPDPAPIVERHVRESV